MTDVPTRWRTAMEDQIEDAEQRLDRAQRYVNDGDGSRAMQEAYPAVVAGATVRVWRAAPPWEEPMPADDMQRRVREQFPNLFAALAEMDLKEVLTRPWQPSDAASYVSEARSYVTESRRQLEAWLAQA